MKIGIIGLGTVGIGVIDIIAQERTRLEAEINEEIIVAYACARSERLLSTPETLYTPNWKDMIEDPQVDTIVELVGGITLAYEVVMAALDHGKNVVTANKALIAHYAIDLFAKAKENHCKLYFEASVGGGIPILTTMKESLIANNICELQGIINGTTNFILSKMETEGYEYAKIYEICGELGYLETDPNLDIDGIDAAHKLCILAMLAFKKIIPFDEIQTKGISEITKKDIDMAGKWNYRIKLLAKGFMEKDYITLDVWPTLIPKSDIFAQVMNEFNACKITGDRTGDVILYGKGAGRFPTASAVVADIMKTAQTTVWDLDFKKAGHVLPITQSQYYVRIDSVIVKPSFSDIIIEKERMDTNSYMFITASMELTQLEAQLKSYNHFIMKVSS